MFTIEIFNITHMLNKMPTGNASHKRMVTQEIVLEQDCLQNV